MEIDQETLLALSDSGKWRLKELDLLRRIEERATAAAAEAASAREAVERVEKSAKEAHSVRFDFRTWAQKSLAYALSLLKSG